MGGQVFDKTSSIHVSVHEKTATTRLCFTSTGFAFDPPNLCRRPMSGAAPARSCLVVMISDNLRSCNRRPLECSKTVPWEARLNVWE
jgi:hypothetical protein